MPLAHYFKQPSGFSLNDQTTFMASQQRLKQSLRDLGYTPSDNSEMPDIPETCMSLISTLVDDLLHSQDRIQRQQSQIDAMKTDAQELTMQVCLSHLTLIIAQNYRTHLFKDKR